MPFLPITMTQSMTAKGKSLGLSGSKFTTFVSAVSSAVCSYLSTASVCTSVNVVVGPGSGVWTGKVVGCIPQLMSSVMFNMAISLGLTGKDTKKLLDAVSHGVCQTLLTTGIAQGFVIGGGPGAGIGKVTSLAPPALMGLIMANMASKGIGGPMNIPLVTAISFGICTHIMAAGTIPTTCVGFFAPPLVGPVPIPAAPGPGRLT